MRSRLLDRLVGLHQHHGRETAEHEGGDPEDASQGSDGSLGHTRDGEGRRLANSCSSRDVLGWIPVQIAVLMLQGGYLTLQLQNPDAVVAGHHAHGLGLAEAAALFEDIGDAGDLTG